MSLGVAAVCGAATAHTGGGSTAVGLAATLAVRVGFATFALAANEPRGSVVTVSVPQAGSQAGRDQSATTA